MTWGKFGLKDLEYLGYFLYTLANLLKNNFWLQFILKLIDKILQLRKDLGYYLNLDFKQSNFLFKK